MGVDSLKRMSQFNNCFEPDEIREQAVPKIPWGTIIEIMKKCKTKESRLWYIQKTHEYGWSRSSLLKQIEAKAYERNRIDDNWSTIFDDTSSN